MLTLRLDAFLRSKGIKKPYAYLKKIGLNHHTVYKLLHKRNLRIPIEVINTICEACYCTPNDLFAWVPPSLQNKTTDMAQSPKDAQPKRPKRSSVSLPKGHPLHKLAPRPASQLLDKLSRMTEEEIKELERKIGE